MATRKGQPPDLTRPGKASGPIIRCWPSTGPPRKCCIAGGGRAGRIPATGRRRFSPRPSSGCRTRPAPMWCGPTADFSSDRFLSAIEQAGGDYLVKVKLRNLRALLARQDWQTIPGQSDTEYCEFTHQCERWDRPRRFIAVRICRQLTTEGLLFPKYHYCHACYVSTLQEAPLELHRCYRDRGEAETWIQAVKSQIGAGTTLVN
ncbi:MAG: transposase [Balneolaceae bacterium]|nr:transposase [Balneolaceae bacterium]